MDYQNDIIEIVSLINAVYNEEANNYQIILEKFTEQTGEDYLDDRAQAIRDKIECDESLRLAFRRLEACCKANKCEECVVNKYCNSYINDARKNANENTLHMVDLFCGAGGLSLGFTQEGFATVLANDIEACCVDTYAHNHPETPRDHIVQGDIRLITDHLEELLIDKRVDIVVGGPPCQGFSMANRQRLIDDPRNHLYKSYVDIVRRIQPKFFVMENVKGMLSVAEQVKEDFRNIGYAVECDILNAKDFGVPQNRERLIYIGKTE